MAFSPDKSDNSLMIVPLKKDKASQAEVDIDWEFLHEINNQQSEKLEVRNYVRLNFFLSYYLSLH